MSHPPSFCGGPFLTNAYLLSCGDKEVLFDAPLGVAGWLSDQGFGIDLLVLTHLHHDHIMDAHSLSSGASPCPVWSHSEFSDELTLQSSLEAATGSAWDLPEFDIERKLEGETELSIGGRRFEVLHIPGHSPDSLCFYDPEENLIIGGDVLFQNGIGRTDFPNGDHELLIRGIREKLWPLPDDTIVYPGHGPPTNIGFEKATNPFLR